MNIQKITSKIMTNKTVLKGLEKLSEHGTSFAAVTSLGMTVGVRPLVIAMTPDVEKENKQYAMSNSIGSGLIKFGVVEAAAVPLEMFIKRIDDNPEKFLKPETIKNLGGDIKNFANSRSYRMVTQIMKLSVGFLTAIPKSVLTVALIPVIMDNVFKNSANNKTPSVKIRQTPNFDLTKEKTIFFTGRLSDNITKKIAGILDNKTVQNFTKKNETYDKDIAKHLTAGTDILLTAATCRQTAESGKIKENRKKALIYNNIISTAVTLIGGYGIDEAIKNKTSRFIERFKKLNANDPKVLKYVEGINILRPTLIFAGIYYGILPLFSTYLSEKIDKFITDRETKQKKFS